MQQYLQHLTARQTEQDSPAQKKNNAGGYSFTLTPIQRLRRFLILGSEGGTYYVGEHALTRDNIQMIRAACKEFPLQSIALIGQISDEGLAPRNTPAILALAVAITTPESGRLVGQHDVEKVCRIGTHWLQLAAAIKSLGGWGRHKRAIFARHFENLPVDKLAYDMAKYQQRDGWSQADLLRLSHPVTTDPARNALFRWALNEKNMGDRFVNRKGAVSTYPPAGDIPLILRAIEMVADAETPLLKKLDLIRDYHLTREMVPTEMLKDPLVWEVMLPHMGATAVIRNLRNMAKMDMLKPFSRHLDNIIDRISIERLVSGRIHPVQVLQGLSALEQDGPISERIMAHLNNAFYDCFKTIKPSEKRTLLALDVSGSMAAPCGNLGFTCAEGATVMAMVTARREPQYHIMGFSDVFRPLGISANDTLATAMKKAYHGTFSGTDCSLPMVWAEKNKIDVDTFVVYTDNETWAGTVHPHVALKRYCQSRGIDAKLVVVGMTTTEFTIAKPGNPNMLDVVGFDSSAPAVISDFSAGRI